jgi:hypothetical protein
MFYNTGPKLGAGRACFAANLNWVSFEEFEIGLTIPLQCPSPQPRCKPMYYKASVKINLNRIKLGYFKGYLNLGQKP